MEEALDLRVPHRGTVQRGRKRGARLELERNLTAFDRDSGRGVHRVELERSCELPREEAFPDLLEAEEGRDRNLQVRWHAAVLWGDSLGSPQLRHQGGPEPRPTVAVPQAPDADVRGGQELFERPAPPHRLTARKVDVEVPEGQWVFAGGDDDMRLAPQPLGERPVVELGRHPGPWIERVGRGRLRSREEEGVRVDHDREVVGPAVSPLRMQVRELREREEQVLVRFRGEGRVERSERGGRLARESVSQVETLEHLVREATRDPRGERAVRHLLLERPRRDRIDADRCGAGRGEGQARAQKRGPHASPDLGMSGPPVCHGAEDRRAIGSTWASQACRRREPGRPAYRHSARPRSVIGRGAGNAPATAPPPHVGVIALHPSRPAPRGPNRAPCPLSECRS